MGNPWLEASRGQAVHCHLDRGLGKNPRNALTQVVWWAE